MNRLTNLITPNKTIPSRPGTLEVNNKRLLVTLPRITIAVVAVAVLTLTACASGPSPRLNPDTEGLTLCPEPRPEVCTMEYRVVCAQMQDGSFKEYSNACSSCSDANVVGYRDGSCPVAE